LAINLHDKVPWGVAYKLISKIGNDNENATSQETQILRIQMKALNLDLYFSARRQIGRSIALIRSFGMIDN